MQPLPSKENCHLILQTKGGGIPYLNDTFTAYLNVKLSNVFFGELLNYLDIFEHFTAHSATPNLLNEFFHLDNIYLGFTEYRADYGCGEDNAFFVQTNTGKGKITSQEFLQCVRRFSPNYTVIPFEFIPSDCGKKRVIRCYKKVKDFFGLVQLDKDDYAKQNFIIPYYPHHKEHIDVTDFKSYLKLSKGMVVITEEASELSYAKIEEYRLDLFSFPIDMKVKANSNHPFDILLGNLIGCNYFEVNFPFVYSEEGKALSIDFDDFDKGSSYGDISAMKDFAYEPKLLDLNDTAYEGDLTQLNPKCKCFTCTTDYKRAYIHHLMKCKELNGTILLTIHNVYQAKELYDSSTSLSTDKEKHNYLMWFITLHCKPSKPQANKTNDSKDAP